MLPSTPILERVTQALDACQGACARARAEHPDDRAALAQVQDHVDRSLAAVLQLAGRQVTLDQTPVAGHMQVTIEDQELVVTWRRHPRAVHYVVEVNGQIAGTVGAAATAMRLPLPMAGPQRVKVIAFDLHGLELGHLTVGAEGTEARRHEGTRVDPNQPRGVRL